MRRQGGMKRSEFASTAFAVVVVALLLLCGRPVEGQDDRRFQAPGVVPLHGYVDLAAAKGFERRLERAHEAKTDFLIVDVDVAQGTSDGARVVCDALRRMGGARRVGFVGRRALGPGAAVLLCCDDVVVRPDAVVGDLSLFASEGDRSEWRKLLETWAKEHRRPVELIAPMMGDGGAATVLNGRETVAARFADSAAETNEDVMQQAGVKGAAQIFADTWVDRTVAILNHPVATTAIVVVGLVFLYVEVAAAGIGLAALPAVLCFLLFFWSKFLGGTAGWLEVVLFLAGLVCLLIEIFLLPGFGVVGAVGVGLVLLSLVMATQGFLLPRTPADSRVLLQTLVQWGAGALLFVAAAAAVTRKIGGLPVVAQLVLEPSADAGSALGVDGLPLPRTMTGVAATDLRPAGKARFGGQLLDVVTDGFYIPAGAEIRVVESSPHRICVTRI